MSGYKPLSQLRIGEKANVVSLGGGTEFVRRLLDLGLISGTSVEAVQRSPSGDPAAYYIRGAVIALRDDDASKILTAPDGVQGFRPLS